MLIVHTHSSFICIFLLAVSQLLGFLAQSRHRGDLRQPELKLAILIFNAADGNFAAMKLYNGFYNIEA